MTERQQMVGAVKDIETALQALATAYAAYLDGYKAAARRRVDVPIGAKVRPNHHEDVRTNRLMCLDHAVGLSRLNRQIAFRLCGLGLEAVLGPGDGRLGDSWVTEACKQIEASVPE